MIRVFIVYYSVSGNTEKMAQGIAEGVRRAGGDALLRKAEEADMAELAGGNAFAIGSPTYFSYMAGMVQYVLEGMYNARAKFSGKPFAAFASGAGGEVGALESIERVCRAVRLAKCAEGVTSAGVPNAATLEACRRLGEKLVIAVRCPPLLIAGGNRTANLWARDARGVSV